MSAQKLFLVVLTSLLLIACSPRAGTGGNESPPATSTPVTAEASSTPVVDSTAPTPEPETPPATPTQAAPVTLGPGTVTPILAVEEGVLNVQEGPTPEWVSYQIRRQDPNIIGPGPRPSPFYVANVTTGKSWIVTSDCNDFFCDVHWTADGQLLWKEQGAVFASDASGATKRNLDAPERIVEILGVSPTGIAVVQGESRLYRLSVADGVWDEVPEPLAEPVPNAVYSTFDGTLGFTADGQAASVSYEKTFGYPYNDTVLLHLPLAFGEAPILIGEPAIDYPGNDGPPPIPPMPLADSNYWMPSQSAFLTNGSAQTMEAIFIDGRSGNAVRQQDVLGVNARVMYTSVSPDRRWIAASLEVNEPMTGQRPLERYYIASTSDLAGGVEIRGSHSGWSVNPPAAFFIQPTGNQTTYLRVSLPDGTVTPLHEMLPIDAYPDAMATESALFVVLDHALGTVEVRSPDGAVVSTQEIPLYRYVFENGQEDYTDLLAVKGSRAYFLGGGVGNLTQAVIYRWDANDSE